MTPPRPQRTSRARQAGRTPRGMTDIRNLPILSDELFDGGPYHYNEGRPHAALAPTQYKMRSSSDASGFRRMGSGSGTGLDLDGYTQ